MRGPDGSRPGPTPLSVSVESVASDAGGRDERIGGRSDDLFERIIVQAHRRDKTISEDVSLIPERQVPDHRTVRVDLTDEVA